jgi:hypothetical protein
VARALVGVGAGVFCAHGEFCGAEAVREFGVFAGGPDGECSAGFQRGVGGGDAGGGVESGVGGVGEGAGAVVDVEEDGVEFQLRGVATQRCGDVGDLDADARIGERMVGERREGAAIPLHDFGDEFGDDHGGAGREKIERGAQRVAHAQAADEDGGLLQRGAAAASVGGERFFGGVHAARHEMTAAGENHVFVIATRELDDGAVGRLRLGEEFEGLHEVSVTDYELSDEIYWDQGGVTPVMRA